MDWIKDLLSPAVNTSIWAAAVYFLGRFALPKVVVALETAGQRVRKIGPVELDPAVIQQEKAEPPKIRQPAEPAALVVPGTVAANQRQELARSIENIPADQQVNWLIAIASDAKAGWFYEVVNQGILGSQIKLLQMANHAPLAPDAVTKIYNDVAAANPEYYATYPLAAWVKWMTDAGLISAGEQSVTIKPDGRELLKYVIAHGRTLIRPF